MRHTRFHYQHKVVWMLAVLLLVSMFLLAGCGPRIGEGVTPGTAEELVVYIPMIYIDFDEQGAATIVGIPAATLGETLGQDMSSLSLDPETIERMMKADVQHVQISNQPNGMLIFINSKPAPALVWDAEVLTSVVSLLDAMGQDIGDAGGLLPLLPQMGLNFALRFPVADGNAEIPMSYSQKAVDGLAATDIRTIADAGAALALELTYAEDGSFELGGINPLMMGMIQGQLAAANLEPDQVSDITEMGIESVGLQVTPGGILISVNGEILPYLKFENEGELFDLMDLGGNMSDGAATALGAIKGPLQQVLPMLRQLGVSLTVQFPTQ